MPRSIILIDFFLSLFFIGGFRTLKRVILESTSVSTNNTIIIGAGSRSANIIKGFLSKEIDYNPLVIVDEDRKNIGTYISNIKVHSLDDLEFIVQKHSITAAIIAKEFKAVELNELFDRLNEIGINDVKKALFLDDSQKELKELSIEDLLAREPKDLDMDVVESFVKNRSILITGGGGSIGSEIASQCAKMGAKSIRLVDSSEYNLYAIGEDLSNYPIKLTLGSVCEKELLDAIFSEDKPEIVIHAAAYKHVPLVEANIAEAIKNNILGTKNCIDVAIAHSVQKIVLISTDKAVRPTNVMGATKRVCELYAQNVDSKASEIVSVRFGNVLGSRGSVIPKFKKQIKNGGPITVTHKDVKRYFMMIKEACALVLQAASIARGGEIFILDMGEPVKISELAKKMLRLYNRDDIEIVYTGLRPGEKLYEELLIDESDKKTAYESIHVAKETEYDIDVLSGQIEYLLKTERKIEALTNIVKEFEHKE
ncbi:MAG: polysaccharide biosynthesis protein, partial [Campylobacterales bacterium]